VYATLSTGLLSVYTVLKDGKSTKKAFGLFGSAVGLVSPELVSGNKHCFRIVNGLEEIVVQAASYEDMMDWSTAIVHGISMENGGGLLLDKAKKETPTMQPEEEPSIFCGFDDNDGGEKSIVFAKQVHASVPARGNKPSAMKRPAKQAAKTNSPPAILKSKSLDSTMLPPLAEKFPTLNMSQSTDLTELNTTFKTLDPVDLSETMHDFAKHFFPVVAEASPEKKPKLVLPLQALRAQDLSYETINSNDSDCLDHSWLETSPEKKRELPLQALRAQGLAYETLKSHGSGECLPYYPWLEIDKASSATGSAAISEDELLDKFSDIHAIEHTNSEDFAALLRLSNGSRVQKIEDLDAVV
jgi:hypothetical protein